MYEYQRGSIWKHETLLAPFNFPIYKTAEDISRERDSLLSSYKPVFNFDPALAEEYILDFKEDFIAEWTDFSVSLLKINSNEDFLSERQYSTYRQLGERSRDTIAGVLKRLYDIGIADFTPVEQEGIINYKNVTLVRNNIASSFPIDRLFTPLEAYEYLRTFVSDSLPKLEISIISNYEAFLNNFQFNNYLAINLNYDEEKSQTIRSQLISSISLTTGLVQEGQNKVPFFESYSCRVLPAVIVIISASGVIMSVVLELISQLLPLI